MSTQLPSEVEISVEVSEETPAIVAPNDEFIPIEDLPSEKFELPSELIGKFEATKGEADASKYQQRNQKQNNKQKKER